MAFFTAEVCSLPPKEIKAKQHPWANTIKELYSHRFKHAHNSIRNPKYPVKEEKQPDPDRVQFTIIGDRVTKEFIYCRNLVIGLHKYKWKNFDVPVIKGCSTTEWPDIWRDLKVRFLGDTAVNCLRSSVAVLVNGRFLGGENKLQQLVESKYYYHLCLDYCNEGVAEFTRFIRSSGRPFAYMHVSIDDMHIGSLIFMLYADIVPNTCENFLRLCKETKGGYGGTPVHRIVKDGWIQCGGFGLKSASLVCENFIIPFDKRGVLAMTNDGRDEDCSTQFFVLLQPAPWMNHKYVAFGQLIEGAATLKKIERVTTWYESPTSRIILYRCGIFNMECHGIMINSAANEYIDGHIEDLNNFMKLLWEHILETVYLKAQLREIERLREQDGEGAMGTPKESVTKKFEKADYDFTLKETEEEEEEKDAYTDLSAIADCLVVEPQRPYYIPLTDVPYPGDVESDFDLKRLLKGDYCLECDLDVNAYENARTKGRPSLLYACSDSDLTASPSDVISLDTEEQQELDDYLINNLDRVSFAGSVVKNIGKKEKNTDIFSSEKKRPSELITDEKLRKLKLATADSMNRERRNTKVSIAVPGAYDPEVHKEIKRRQTGFVNAADLEKIRIFSRQHFGTDDDDDSQSSDDGDDDEDQWSKKPTVHIDPGAADSSHAPRRPKRRPTGFISSSAVPLDVDDDDDYDDEDDDDDIIPTPVDNTHKDDDDIVEPEKSKAPKFRFSTANVSENKGFLKRRLTAYVRPGDLPVDDDDNDDDDDDNEEETAPQHSFTPKSNGHKSHFATQESPEETAPSEALMHRRPTAFVRPGKLPVDDDDDNEEEPAPQTSFTPKSNGHKSHFATQESPEKTAPSKALMNRRPTAFVRPGKLPVDDDDNDEEPFVPKKTGSKSAEESKMKHFAFQKTGDYKDPAMKPSITTQTRGSKFADEDDKVTHTMKRRPTAFVRAADIPESDDDSEHEVRGSVLTRLYDAIDNDEPVPTLKNYKPTAELKLKKCTKHFLTDSVLPTTSEQGMLESKSKPLRHSPTLDDSFEDFANIQHGTKLDNKLSSDYVKTIDKFENRFSHSIRSMQYAKRRPTISVSQYQLMNQQYQKALDRKPAPL